VGDGDVSKRAEYSNGDGRPNPSWHVRGSVGAVPGRVDSIAREHAARLGRAVQPKIGRAHRATPERATLPTVLDAQERGQPWIALRALAARVR
jgi:hypothetical protein